MAKLDPEILAHLEWIGFVRPTGLVVSAPALVRAGAIIDRRDAEGQLLLRACIEESTFDTNEGPVPSVPDFRAFATSILGWSFSPKGYAGTTESPIPPELEVPLPDYGETLQPDFAVRELEALDGASSWQLIVCVLEAGEDFDCIASGSGRLEASAHSRMERLLRQTDVPAGVLFNGRTLRLVSAPRGETSGWLDFQIADMAQTAGRPISTALRLLLGEPRLLSLPRPQRLTALLHNSRKYQNEVSERLAEQVLHALYEFLRGFQAAQDASGHELLREPLAEHPDEIYRALLTVILRLVFLLYAEERDMLPGDETYLRYYSLGGLYERPREDAALFPDTMDQRYGAWAQLLVLFRMIHDGAESGAMRLPKRHGVLFDPDRFTFLEGRSSGSVRQIRERIEVPLVPDGTIYRALEKLLVLDGERISYRALDVEQIGSVYETMMGFRLETASGRSVAIKAQKKRGAPTAVNIEALLLEPASKRAKWLQDRADRKLTDKLVKALAAAATIEDLHAALLPVIDTAATPDLASKGSMVLQPSEERRRSGSHYTPRALTQPIALTTLGPVLARLRGAGNHAPTPGQILDIKVCDPAMGSGAFLVEACRQLGEALVEAWHAHGQVPTVPPDEDELVYARRMIAQRCLYGIDRNPVAVDLAKVSLWLVTLAKDHPLTFVDHALRHGDSLVGLSRKQIEAFHWNPDAPRFEAGFEAMRVREHVDEIAGLRERIRSAEESVSDWELRDLWDSVQYELGKVRLSADLILAAFFGAGNPKEREKTRSEFATAVVNGEAERYRDWLDEWRHGSPALAPFHWEIEFPEVFERQNAGFDAIIGNPPFMGGSKISTTLSKNYAAYLAASFREARGKSDLVAYFFRRTFDITRTCGTSGLVATNTIHQGATRFTGLRWIRAHGGRIYSATRRLQWPGTAAVIVSVVHVDKCDLLIPCVLDGNEVSNITAYLLSFGPDQDPAVLSTNKRIAYSGINPNGKGFVLTSKERELLVAQDDKCARKIFPYLGSVDMNDSPNASATRFIVCFDDCDENAVRAYPSLYRRLYDTVRVQRQTSNEKRLRERWWCFSRPAEDLGRALKSFDRVLVSGRVATHHTFTFQPTTTVFSDAVTVFVFDRNASFAVLQSRIHELWAGFQGSSFKDDPRYIPEDCFETFPFPEAWETNSALEAAGKAYYEHRAALMASNNQGLTKTYNRFHDPDDREPRIARLRELHAAMDRAVLDAYGWDDISTNCGFLLDYEIDEDEWGNRKKPYRYRWRDDIHDEVLARLLELNAERAKEEAFPGHDAKKRGGNAASKPAKRPVNMEALF